ncbi:MAG: FAD-dependent monooxygenase [Xanthomonadales bacterium PRO7]|nr:FAD-dependent monooxygenase [Xanthomonadales bacterium PRO7]
MPMKPEITMIGAGLVGALAATLLAQRGFAVTVFERRPDPRVHGFQGGRSINLALAERGWHGLRVAGLQKRIEPIAVMMRGRMVHHADGHTELLRYGRDDSEVIWSVSRGALNMALLDAAEQASARIHFGQRLDSVDWDSSTLHFGDDAGSIRTHEAKTIIGADGAGSALRAAMGTHSDLRERFEPLEHGYKELEIPALDSLPPPAGEAPRSGEGGKFAMEPNALHIWPRGNYMCIALPNAQGSFTVTLFMPNSGKPGFDSVRSGADAHALFARDFGDALPLIPDLEKDFDTNPTGILGTLYLDRWHLAGRALLIGDAAHAIVPFHGQGMNCGFEDAVELADLLQDSSSDFETVFAQFQHRRKPNADAIAAMALENYIEMRDSVADAHFLLMRALERQLAARHPGRFVPRYWMVTFSRLPYSVAFERGEIQSGILRELTTGKTALDQVDLTLADRLVDERLPPLAQ